MFTKKRNKRKLRNRKKIPLAIVFSSVFSIMLLIVAGVGAVLFYQPKVISPLPLIKNVLGIQNSSNTEIRIKELLQENKIEYRSMRRNSDGYDIILKEGETIRVGQSKAVDEQIASLQVIYNRLTMEGKRFLVLDLRFDKPVIVFR